MPIDKCLPPGQFDSVVRWIKRAEADRLAQFDNVLTLAVRRLGITRWKARTAVGGVPEGSDHYELGSLIEWLDRITPDDREAVEQVRRLFATIRVRLGG